MSGATTTVYRDVFGPGQRSNGARFRDEVVVCTRCKHVYIARMFPGGRCPLGTTGRLVPRHEVMRKSGFKTYRRHMTAEKLEELVPEPCDGILLPPIAWRGWSWNPGVKFTTEGGPR